MSTINQRS